MAAVRPDDEDRVFVARWNALVSALLVETSIKAVAWQAGQYGIADGASVYPGNERLARQTCLSEKSVREALHFLRAAGMAVRIAPSAWTGDHRTADLYGLAIPEHWHGMAMLGPHAGRFTCQQCGKQFNAPPCNTFAKDDTGKPLIDRDTGCRRASWYLYKAVFCAPPRKGLSCFDRWQKANRGKWADAAWELFRKARDDDW